MKKVLKSFLFLIMVSLSVTLVHAQQPGSLDMTFNAHDTILYNYLQRANENITATTVQSDGKIIFAGITKPSLFYPKLVRLNADGSNDNSFVPPAFQANNAIKKIIVLGTGKILVVTSQSSATPWSSSLIGLNSDGSIDSDFNIGSTVGTIFDLMLLPDGKILAIGSFQTYNSIAMKYMVKLNLDGSLDSSFPSQNISNSSFSYCTFQSDGKILVASGSMILRFDQNGTYDPSFIISVSGAISIIGITVQQDDKLLLTTYNNISQITNVDRYIADATLDVLFTKPTIGKTAYLLTSSFVNGKILLVGDFKTINSVTKSGVVLLSNDGQIDPLFQSILPATTVAKSSTINTDGSFLLSTNKGIMKFNSLGAFINVYVPLISVDGLISNSIMQLDGKLIIGGDFSAYNGQACIDIVRLNLDGSIDPSFTSPFDSPYCSISFLVLQFDGKILVGGSLFNGKSLVRLNSDGTIDPTFITTYEPPMLFNTCTLQSDGKLVLSSGYAPHIFRLNSDGSTDNSFQAKSNSLTSGNIVAIAVQSDKKIIIGGFFSLYDGRKTGFARLNEDGSVDETFRVGNNPIPNQGVWALSIQPDGRILVAGSFNVFNGTTTGSLTRLNRDGSIDLTFAVGKVWSSVKSVKYQPDGKILIGGDFTSYAGVARYKIARLNFDGSLDLSFIPEQLMWNRFYLVEHLNIHPTGIYAVGINTLNKGIVVRMNSEPIINNCFYTNILYKDVKDITCTGIKGYATVEAISDFPPFQYAWGNSTDPTNPYQEFTSAGIHGVTITDAKGCIRSSSLLITAPKYINAYDVTANLRPTTFRPGVASNISISLYNEGCIPAYGKLKLLLSTIVDYTSSSPVAVISGDTLIWDFASLGDDAYFNFNVSVTTKTVVALGDQVCLGLFIVDSPLALDQDLSNNTKNYCYNVVNSYDPNDKQVYPQGDCTPHFVEDGNVLTYTLRFQNTGNASAYNIYITDTLSSDLDISSVRIIERSHEMFTEILPNNVVKFNFNDIFLPDATTDEEASHGYVVFEVKPFVASHAGVYIEGQANIYFDYNDPVITNSVFNTVIEGIPFADVSVTQQGNILTANAINTTYKWASCSNPDTELETISVFEIPDGDSYAVTIVTEDGCKAKSDCYSAVLNSVNEENNLTLLKVYPNPVQDVLNVVCAYDLQQASLKIINTTGSVIYETVNINSTSFNIDIANQPKGFYILEIMQGEKTSRARFVKQ